MIRGSFKGRILLRISLSYALTAIALAVVGFRESLLLAEEPSAGSLAKSTTTVGWKLPPEEQTLLDYEVDRIRQKLNAHSRVGEFEKALVFHREELDATRRIAGACHWRTVSCQVQVDELVQMCKLNRDQRQAFLGARDLIGNARVLVQKEDYDSALAFLLKAQKIQVDLLPENSGLVLSCHDLIMQTYWLKGDGPKAKAYGEATIAEFRRVYGEESPEYIRLWGIQGAIYELNTELDRAETTLRHVVAEAKRLGGKDDKIYLDNLNRLGRVLHKQKKLEEAESVWRKTQETCDKYGLTGASPLRFCLRGLTELYRDQGRFKEAEATIRRVLEIDMKLFGDKQPVTATDLESYAQLLRKAGRAAEAEPLEAQAKRAREFIEKQDQLAKNPQATQ